MGPGRQASLFPSAPLQSLDVLIALLQKIHVCNLQSLCRFLIPFQTLVGVLASDSRSSFFSSSGLLSLLLPLPPPPPSLASGSSSSDSSSLSLSPLSLGSLEREVCSLNASFVAHLRQSFPGTLTHKSPQAEYKCLLFLVFPKPKPLSGTSAPPFP